jgi:hypothetical protein
VWRARCGRAWGGACVRVLCARPGGGKGRCRFLPCPPLLASPSLTQHRHTHTHTHTHTARMLTAAEVVVQVVPSGTGGRVRGRADEVRRHDLRSRCVRGGSMRTSRQSTCSYACAHAHAQAPWARPHAHAHAHALRKPHAPCARACPVRTPPCPAQAYAPCARPGPVRMPTPHAHAHAQARAHARAHACRPCPCVRPCPCARPASMHPRTCTPDSATMVTPSHLCALTWMSSLFPCGF